MTTTAPEYSVQPRHFLPLRSLTFLTALCALGVLNVAAADVRTWAGVAFLGEPETLPAATTGVEVRRQDHAVPQYGRSAGGTTLKIGDRSFEHGLGTHAFSEIAVHLPKPGKTFTAQIGVDNNRDTAGKHGTIEFVVEVAGREAFRSGVCRGGEAPRAISVDLGGAQAFTLRVTDGGDGTPYDQGDWADAGVTFTDGESTLLDKLPLHLAPARLAPEEPLSFVYGGKPSRELLRTWRRSARPVESSKGRKAHEITWADPETALEVTCTLTTFEAFPAAEWVVHFRNAGKQDSPVLESILPLDLKFAYPPKGDCTLHHAHGSANAPTDFLPRETQLPSFSDVKLAPNGGRSSDGNLPFFNLQWSNGGLVAAIGWSGQWSMRLQRPEGRELTWQAGQQIGRFKLRPGESVRTPRILLASYEGTDRLAGNNLLRRLLLEQYVPRTKGKITLPPLAANTWFTFGEGNGVNEANQLESIRAMEKLKLEAYWLDAGWFEGGWPRGVGSWVPKADAFPNGLRPLGDAAHRAGMRFVLWFEPERVNSGSRIAKEHSEWVLRDGDGDGLFNLGDPAARAWLTDHLSNCIKEWGVDICRIDFNIAPLRFWQKADEPDRQGLAEIRYIEGLYALWDALRERHPGLVIDNCASGGRRIDLETTARSIPLWRSDTPGAGKPLPVQDQGQTAGLSMWVPLHSAGLWSFEPYACRSVMTTGASLSFDLRSGVSVEQANAMLGEALELRPLQLGDFYPLLDINLDERGWCAWQFNLPEAGTGYAMAFRREKSPYAAVDLSLKGIDASARYDVTFRDGARKVQMTGEELASLRVEVPSRPGSEVVLYKRLK